MCDFLQINGKIKKTPGSSEGAEILGIHVEGPFINNDKKGAHDLKYIHKFTHVSLHYFGEVLQLLSAFH